MRHHHNFPSSGHSHTAPVKVPDGLKACPWGGQAGRAAFEVCMQEQFAKQIPLGYFGDPSDMANLVTFLCSPKARYISGERIHVDGGLRRAY